MTKYQIWKLWFFIWLVSTTIATLGVSLICPKGFLWGNLVYCAVVLAIPIVYLESCNRLIVSQEPLPMKHLAIITVLLYTFSPFWISLLIIWHWSGYTVTLFTDKIPPHMQEHMQGIVVLCFFSILTIPSGLILLIVLLIVFIFHKS